MGPLVGSLDPSRHNTVNLLLSANKESLTLVPGLRITLGSNVSLRVIFVILFLVFRKNMAKKKIIKKYIDKIYIFSISIKLTMLFR